MKRSIWFGSFSVLLFALALSALPATAPAADINKTTSSTGSANDLVGNGGNYGNDNRLQFGPSATGQTFIVNSGTLTDGTVNTEIISMNILGNSNIVTFTGSSTQVVINNRRNWKSGGTGNGSFHVNGTGNTMNVLAGAQFRANGWNGLDGSGNTIHVDGAGSVAGFCVEYNTSGQEDGNDGFGNSSGSDQYTTNRINITNGGLVHVGDNGIHNLVANAGAGNYAVNVDGAGGRSTFRVAQVNDMGAGGGGILHAFNGGAFETDDFHGQNPNTWSVQSGRESKFFIDGGVLSYRNATAVNMHESLETGTVSLFTYAGNNAMRLNNSTATDTGSYTLANNLGPKNYTRLEMINGTTSVARDISVDGYNGGSILFDSTTASIAAGVTLSGTATLTATGAPSTLTGVIGGIDGTLLKDGTGMLTLQSANIYSGDTLVQSGTLSIVSAYLADASNVKLDISGLGGTLNLNTSSAVDTIKKLYINGALQLAGLWGAIGSSAPHQSSFITGSGELSVTEGLITTVDGVWASNTVGNTLWSDAGNWTGGKPVARGDTATLGTGSVPVIDLAGTSQTVSALTFNNEGSAHYEIKDTIGGGSLMLWGTGSSPASVKVTTGSDAISANLVLASNLEVSGSGTLALSGSISGGTGFSLTMSGTNGTLILSGTGLYGGTIVKAGTLAVTTSTALPDNQSLTVGAGGTLIFDPSFHASAIQSASPTMSAVAPVPEPGTLALLLAAGLVGLGAWRRGKK